MSYVYGECDPAIVRQIRAAKTYLFQMNHRKTRHSNAPRSRPNDSTRPETQRGADAVIGAPKATNVRYFRALLNTRLKPPSVTMVDVMPVNVADSVCLKNGDSSAHEQCWVCVERPCRDGSSSQSLMSRQVYNRTMHCASSGCVAQQRSALSPCFFADRSLLLSVGGSPI